MQNAELDESQTGIKTSGRNINNLRFVNDTTLLADSEQELELLDKSEREEWCDLNVFFPTAWYTSIKCIEEVKRVERWVKE